MKKRLDIPQTLSEEEAKLVIEVLEEVIDVLCRQLHALHHHVEPPDPGWETPEWALDPDDQEEIF